MEEEMYTVQEVAKKLRITRKGVYDLMRDGQLRYLQIGMRRRRITGTALREFLRARERGIGSDAQSEYNPDGTRSPSHAADFIPA